MIYKALRSSSVSAFLTSENFKFQKITLKFY